MLKNGQCVVEAAAKCSTTFEICGFGIGYGIGRKYQPIWVLVSVLDLNQNSGFGRTLEHTVLNYILQLSSPQMRTSLRASITSIIQATTITTTMFSEVNFSFGDKKNVLIIVCTQMIFFSFYIAYSKILPYLLQDCRIMLQRKKV